MRVGFTGTRVGMTPAQQDTVRELLIKLIPYQGSYGGDTSMEAYHGCCVGADEQFNDLAHDYNWTTNGLPASDVAQLLRSSCVVDNKRIPMPALERNRWIADNCQVLIATPATFIEKLRSGTWATIRHARYIKRHMYLVTPDGKVTEENNV